MILKDKRLGLHHNEMVLKGLGFKRNGFKIPTRKIALKNFQLASLNERKTS